MLEIDRSLWMEGCLLQTFKRQPNLLHLAEINTGSVRSVIWAGKWGEKKISGCQSMC